MPNIKPENAKKILDIIQNRPSLYNQQHWITPQGRVMEVANVDVDQLINDEDAASNLCGTQFCVAGWAAVLTGWSFYQQPIKAFAKRFGTEAIKEVYAKRPETIQKVEEGRFDALSGWSASYFRTPEGTWNTDGHESVSPDYSAIGQEFLGLTTPHGKWLARRLFRGNAPKDEVIDALTALSEGRYPEALVTEVKEKLSAALAALDEVRETTAGYPFMGDVEGSNGERSDNLDNAITELRREYRFYSLAHL